MKRKNFKDAALFWLRYGFLVIPLGPGRKVTAIRWDGWLDGLTEEKVLQYWSEHPDHEVGLIVGDKYIVFDADTPESLATLQQLEDIFDVTPYLVVKTAKGEHHYYARAEGAYAKSDGHCSEKFPDRIDVKTGRALVVLPPSTGKTVELCEVRSAEELTQVGQEFIDAVFLHNGRKEPRPPEPAKPRTDVVVKNHVKLQELVNSIDPDSGYEDWLSVLMAVNTETQGSDEGFKIVDGWSSRGGKYPGRDKMRYLWDNFRGDIENPKALGTIIHIAKQQRVNVDEIIDGTEAFEVCETVVSQSNVPSVPEVPKLPQGKNDGALIQRELPEPEIMVSDELATIQQQFALINMDGKLWVIDLESLSDPDNQGLTKKLELSSLNDGKLLITRALKALFPRADAKEVLAEFFVSPKTACFNGVEFNPAETSKNCLNLWVGPTAKPCSGMWGLIKDFLLNVICNGNNAVYQYLIRYIAHALQRPEEKPGVMIIMLGGQGVGKGTVGRIFQKIWSASYIQINNIDNITGSFNAALERSFIVFLDEALFVGNRRGSDALKSLVTESFIQINEKYQPSRQTRSCHRFIAATNADHFKNTERDDRRDFTLRVSDKYKGDHEYWQKLNDEIEHGGVEAMVHDLLAMDLSDFNVRDKPATGELMEQKLLSLDHTSRCWHDCLNRGSIGPGNVWPEFVRTNDIIAEIEEFSGGRIFRKPTPHLVSRDLKKFCPSATNTQKQDQLERARGYNLPTLSQARTEFEQYIGGPLEWDDYPEA